jgi:hypothetical protein
MAERYDPDQMLLDLARNEGPDVVHLPYTSGFEAVCQHINPAATTEDKHRIWEQLLELGEVNTSLSDATAPTQAAPVTVPRPEPSVVSAKPTTPTSRAFEESGYLFPIHDPDS